MTKGAAKRPRDERLDFFRGIAMLIILVAHTPGNSWTLWIPARFGFSDATEIFVFCSGLASSFAFGRVFAGRGWMMGTLRTAFRVWQVYWAQIGMVLAAMLLVILLDLSGTGPEGHSYVAASHFDLFLNEPVPGLLALFTLTYVPANFNILPMYIVILALMPAVMLAHRLAGLAGVAAFSILLWAIAQAGLAELPVWGHGGEPIWFFNPFAWQIIFFTGFAFGMGWVPAPPRSRVLVVLAAAFLILSLPLATFRLYGGVWLPEEASVTLALGAIRGWIEVLVWKSWLGAGRYLHFLAVAYLAWMAVGPRGIFLQEGWNDPGPARRPWLIGAGIVAVLTAPYALVEVIPPLTGAIDAWLTGLSARLGGAEPFPLPLASSQKAGLPVLLHVMALALLVWSALGHARRQHILRDGFLRVVPLIRLVGSQSLAVFMTSMVLALANGWLLDLIGRNAGTYALVNVWGFGVCLTVAFIVSWFKSEPWSRSPERGAPPPREAAPSRMPVAAE